MHVFNALTLKAMFSKTKTVFEKLEYQVLVEDTRNLNGTFLYKTVLSEANAKKNRMGSTRLTYHKERSFSSNYFNLSKNSFSLRTSYKELVWFTNHSNVHIHTFRKPRTLIWRFFSLWAFLNIAFNLLKSNFIEERT